MNFLVMDKLTNVQGVIDVLENNLKSKRNEYQEALNRGVIFDDLKKIFLGIKKLEEKLKNIKASILPAITENK